MEGIMTVSIMIQRVVKDQSTARKLIPLIIKLRSKAMAQPGFLTGQTFTCMDYEGEYMVISSWNTIEDWNRWMHDEERQAIQRKVDELLGEKTKYRYYEPVVGGIVPQFQN